MFWSTTTKILDENLNQSYGLKRNLRKYIMWWNWLQKKKKLQNEKYWRMKNYMWKCKMLLNQSITYVIHGNGYILPKHKLKFFYVVSMDEYYYLLVAKT